MQIRDVGGIDLVDNTLSLALLLVSVLPTMSIRNSNVLTPFDLYQT